jgi:hypothetical protein
MKHLQRTNRRIPGHRRGARPSDLASSRAAAPPLCSTATRGATPYLRGHTQQRPTAHATSLRRGGGRLAVAGGFVARPHVANGLSQPTPY